MSFPNTSTLRRHLTAGALITTTLAAAALGAPTQASATSRPKIRALQAFDNRCPHYGDAYGIAVYTIGGTARTATAVVGGTPRAMQGGPTPTRGRGYFVLPLSGMKVGQRVRTTVTVRGPGGWSRTTRTLRVQLTHVCQG